MIDCSVIKIPITYEPYKPLVVLVLGLIFANANPDIKLNMITTIVVTAV